MVVVILFITFDIMSFIHKKYINLIVIKVDLNSRIKEVILKTIFGFQKVLRKE